MAQGQAMLGQLVLQARTGPGHPQFEHNRAGMLALLADLEASREAALGGGGERYRARHLDRGRLLVRQRVELLNDEHAPLLELSVVTVTLCAVADAA